MSTLLFCAILGWSQPATAVPVGNKTPTALVFEIEPDSVVIHVDGKRKGTAGKVKKVPVNPGRHLVRLVNDRDETEFEVKVRKGESLKVQYMFEDSGSQRPAPPAEEPGSEKKPENP